jgi:folate-binding protein YgfZ
MAGVTTVLPRSFIRAAGRDAISYVQSMVSNDVAALAPGEGVYALLLTPKARIVADLEVFRVGDDELALAAHPDVGAAALETLLRSRFRAKVDLEPSDGALVWGGETDGALATLATPAGPVALLPAAPADAERSLGGWEVARVEAGVPRYGREFDESAMPAEAGLVPLAISFTKGCYPGQEPVARLQHRGHANRGVRGLEFPGQAAPDPGTPVEAGGRAVGRVTSVVRSPRFGAIGLGVLRREVENGATVDAGGRPATVRALPFS